jgi:hypothetical protein
MSDTVLIPSGNALHYVSVVYISDKVVRIMKMSQWQDSGDNHKLFLI